MNEDEILKEALEAKILLENKLLEKLFNNLEEKYTNFWKASPFADTEAREQAYRMLVALGDVKRELRATYDAGVMVQMELNYKQS